MVRVTEAQVRDALAEVKDPEIPSCSIIELGMVERVAVAEGRIEVDLLPTFAGCPALDMIKADVAARLDDLAPGTEAIVRSVMAPAWTTDRITPEGRAHLGTYGISPPVVVQLGRPSPIVCPYCGAGATSEGSAFGPTPCRAIRYCPSCRNPFEAFKPK
jgi:ring-1,2-phenylacetyl-CoA epoxidase subunit PaaD